MKIVIDVPESHMPFVRQQVDLHGPEVRLNFEHFPALLKGEVVGQLAESLLTPGEDHLLYYIEPVVAGP